MVKKRENFKYLSREAFNKNEFWEFWKMVLFHYFLGGNVGKSESADIESWPELNPHLPSNVGKPD